MTQFIEVPPQRLQAEVLESLLEEFASRDGTDYGVRESSLEQKVAALHKQLQRRDLLILYETDGEHWDILPREQALALLND